MVARKRSVIVATLMLTIAACGSDAGSGMETSAPLRSALGSPIATAVAPPTTEPTGQVALFPVTSFAAISQDPVSAELAARFQAALALQDVTGGGGMSATVMTNEGTWGGTTGKADGVRTYGSTTNSRSRA